MKKLSILAIAIAGITFTACKKDRTCECITTGSSSSTTVTSGGQTITNTNANPGDTSTVVYKKAKKSNLKTVCGDQKSTYTSTSSNNGSSYSSTSTNDTKCKLK